MSWRQSLFTRVCSLGKHVPQVPEMDAVFAEIKEVATLN